MDNSSVSDIKDRRDESRKWMQLNYWDEWEDAWRNSKCLSKKILITDKSGNEVEDSTRTNVCMPETSLIIRRKTARLTANPPQINFTSPAGNEDIGQKLTAWKYQQFDRSGEMQQHRRMVHTGVTFGFACSKRSWDCVQVTRQFYKAFVGSQGNVQYRDRAGVMRLQGAPEDEISGAVNELGPELSNPEVAQAIATLGNVVQVPEQIKKYEGPTSKNIFPGDLFLEPGCLSINESGWAVENYWETDLWLQKMVKKQYIDPETGEPKPVFDSKAAEELMELGTWAPNQGSSQPYDLRTRFRSSVLNQTQPMFPTRLLPGKRFDILEHHCRDEYGQMWISWVGNEKVLLGRMPYPWDLYGKYVYTEFVPLFDILSVIGDSTPRLMRFLQALHNATVGARKDLVNQILRPTMLVKAGADIPDEHLDRRLYRMIVVKDFGAIQPMIEPQNIGLAIQAANEEEAQIMRQIALLDPNMTNVESGTEANPQAGKTATTAVLAAKSADALTQFELDSLHWYLKQSGEIDLAMLQQNQTQDPYQVAPKYYSRVEGLSDRYGKTAMMTIDPMEIQEDLDVEPEAMSMLSVDDDIRRQSALQLAQMAAQMPGIVDPYYTARYYAGTIRGVDPDKAVPPPQPPQPPAPKSSFTIAAKFELLPAQAQAAILQNYGLINEQGAEELNLEETLEGVVKANQAAGAADELLSKAPSHQQEDATVRDQLNRNADREPDTNLSRGVNG